jgi:uncharacterized protein YndB with AHSA1/START domain
MSTPTITEERIIAAPPATVAAAIASPFGLANWFCDDARVERRPRGRVVLSWHTGGQACGRWTTYDPPGHLAWSWRDETNGRESVVSFELTPAGSGTHVRVAEEGIAAENVAEVTQQWEDALADLKAFVEEGHNARELRRPLMGISPMSVTPEEAARKGYPVERGILISELTAGGGSEAAGLAKDDIVVRIDSHDVSDWSTLTGALSNHRAGETVEVTFWRAGEQRMLPVTLKGRERPALPETPAALREMVHRTTAEMVTALQAALEGVDEPMAAQAPAPGEWSIKQVLAHLLVGERFSQDWMSRVACDDALVDWPERADGLLQRVVAKAEVEELARELFDSLRMTAALVDAALDDDPTPAVFHQMAAQTHFMPTHIGEHVAQIRAAKEAVAAMAAPA